MVKSTVLGFATAAFVMSSSAAIEPPNLRVVRNWSNVPKSGEDYGEYIEPWDKFLFTESTSLDGPPRYGPPIHLADPTIQWLSIKDYDTQSSDPGRYFITGTDTDRALANFAVYKSTTLAKFVKHRYAFKETDRVGRVIRINGGTDLWAALQSPQLLLNQNEAPGPNRKIYLVFSAIRAPLTEAYLAQSPGTPWTFGDVKTIPHWDPARRSVSSERLNPLFASDTYFRTGIGSDGVPHTDLEIPDSYWNTDPTQFPSGWSGERKARFSEVVFQSLQYVSTYIADMKLSDFLDENSTTYFSTPRKFGYLNGSSRYYDGGAGATGTTSPPNFFVPSSLDAIQLDEGYSARVGAQASWSYSPNSSGSPIGTYSYSFGPGLYQPYGMLHRYPGQSDAHYPWSAATVMTDGGFIFFDPKSGPTKTAYLIFGWRDIGAFSGSVDFRGNHVAVTKLLTGGNLDTIDTPSDWINGAPSSSKNYFDPLFFGVSFKNPIPFFQDSVFIHDVLNGWQTVSGDYDPADWRVAESAAAYYDSDRDAYFVFASRNQFSSPGYCLAYRRHTGSLFSSTFMPFYYPTSASDDLDERLLISSKVYGYPGGVATLVDLRGELGRRSYGMGEIIDMRNPDGTLVLDSNGHRVPMVVFSAKFDGSRTERTLFFKRLRMQSSGESAGYFYEYVDRAPDEQLDTLRMELPFCKADFNLDGVVDLADYFDFLNAFEDQDPSVDFSGVFDEVGGDDWAEFFSAWDAGC